MVTVTSGALVIPGPDLTHVTISSESVDQDQIKIQLTISLAAATHLPCSVFYISPLLLFADTQFCSFTQHS